MEWDEGNEKGGSPRATCITQYMRLCLLPSISRLRLELTRHRRAHVFPFFTGARSTALLWWPVFFLSFFPFFFFSLFCARCLKVLAAAVLFSVQLRATSLPLPLPEIHTYISLELLIWKPARLVQSCSRDCGR